MLALKLEGLLRLLKLELLLKRSSNELEGKIYCIIIYASTSVQRVACGNSTSSKCAEHAYV